MDGIVPHLRRANKRRLLKEARKCTDRQLRIRYWTVVNLLSCLRNPTSDAGEHKSTTMAAAHGVQSVGQPLAVGKLRVERVGHQTRRFVAGQRQDSPDGSKEVHLQPTFLPSRTSWLPDIAEVPNGRDTDAPPGS